MTTYTKDDLDAAYRQGILDGARVPARSVTVNQCPVCGRTDEDGTSPWLICYRPDCCDGRGLNPEHVAK